MIYSGRIQIRMYRAGAKMTAACRLRLARTLSPNSLTDTIWISFAVLIRYAFGMGKHRDVIDVFYDNGFFKEKYFFCEIHFYNIFSDLNRKKITTQKLNMFVLRSRFWRFC